jgi:ammonium transporter, Amt family
VDLSQVSSWIDSGWLFIAAGLVFFMRAGFLALEAGLTQKKNSANVSTKNLVDLAIAVTIFWLYGFGVMFGQSDGGLGFFGTTRFSPDFSTIAQTVGNNAPGLSLAAFFFYQVMFSNTAVVILSGATSERMRFETYLILSIFTSALIYPVFGHWAWNGLDGGELLGWLGQRGFVDFAGSTVVHSVGAWAALAVLLILKPRLGRYDKHGVARDLPKASFPLALVGTFILWFGWFGFNGGSTLLTSGKVDLVLTNTLIAGVAGMIAVIPVQLLTNSGVVKADYLMNGALVGLVAITANAHAVSTQSAFIIGLVGGWVMLLVDWLLVAAHIDDAIGAVPVHLGGGIWGTLAVALFGNPTLLQTGLSFTGQLNIQLIGIAVAGAWAFGVMFMVASTLNIFLPLRVSVAEEQRGLNSSEQGILPDYSEFPGLQELLQQWQEVQADPTASSITNPIRNPER